ncbi:hypothetical protein JRX38_11235 [Gluconobacter cerinus]|nr:hypothetical protein [Gluconobacter cerinus]MBM3098577.1 hypothetical protein [Gluconobacter cerinus]
MARRWPYGGECSAMMGDIAPETMIGHVPGGHLHWCKAARQEELPMRRH